MSQPIATKTLKMIQYFKDHPTADVKKVAEKFKCALPKTYAIRKRARTELSFVLPIIPPVPEPTVWDTSKSLDEAFGVSLKDVPDHPADEATRKAIEKAKQTDVDAVLDTRALDYGKFKDGAALMQALKRTLADHAQKHGKTFADDQWEALEMIVHKIGRIVNGNPDKVDHWTDIAGYAKLIADRLEGVER